MVSILHHQTTIKRSIILRGPRSLEVCVVYCYFPKPWDTTINYTDPLMLIIFCYEVMRYPTVQNLPQTLNRRRVWWWGRPPENRGVSSFQRVRAKPRTRGSNAEKWHVAWQRAQLRDAQPHAGSEMQSCPYLICSCARCPWHMPAQTTAPPAAGTASLLQSVCDTPWLWHALCWDADDWPRCHTAGNRLDNEHLQLRQLAGFACRLATCWTSSSCWRGTSVRLWCDKTGWGNLLFTSSSGTPV